MTDVLYLCLLFCAWQLFIVILPPVEVGTPIGIVTVIYLARVEGFFCCLQVMLQRLCVTVVSALKGR
jgi:hypothetical protein